MNQYKSKSIVKQYLDFLKTESMAIVYDLETTGLNPSANHIIEATARLCIVSEHGFDEIDSRTWYINPGYQIPEKIVSLTGITNEFLADKPREYEVVSEIVQFFGNYPVIGYNNDSFDNQFMEYLYSRYGYHRSPKMSFDIYTLVKTLFQPNQLANQKLATVSDYFGVTKQIEAFHNSDADTMATLLVANHLVQMCKEERFERTGNVKCRVTRVAYWENPKNWKMKRLYVDTNVTRFYFDLFNQTWNPVYNDDLIHQYDMPYVIRQVLLITGCKDENELSKIKKRK